MQLIQFSWLTFFFVVFNLLFVGVFLMLFMKDKGELLLRCRLVVVVNNLSYEYFV